MSWFVFPLPPFCWNRRTEVPLYLRNLRTLGHRWRPWVLPDPVLRQQLEGVVPHEHPPLKGISKAARGACSRSLGSR